MRTLRSLLQKLLPRSVYHALTLPYHYALAVFSAVLAGFPSRKLVVIGVTGTKGKSSVSDMLYSVLHKSGYAVCAASTIRFAINEKSEPNLYKMTLPGRGFIQRFLQKAVRSGCTHAVVEITSESTKLYRHLFLDLNALIFTNLQKEHIESHGSYEKYAAAKFRIGTSLLHSRKRPRAIIANSDDAASAPYLALPLEEKHPFSYQEAENLVLTKGHVSFTYKGVSFSLHLPGSFSVMNALAVIHAAEFVGVPLEKIASALASLERIPGRTERIEEGQPFTVVVDYAHTPDSLEALYGAYPGKKICVLGNTGGGRDTWKRPEMGHIADRECEQVFLTDEDPYDEDPHDIVEAMARGMKRKPTIIMDRREAIRAALRAASPDSSVLITGKGTDPFIMRANGTKEPWSDAQVVREELKQLVS